MNALRKLAVIDCGTNTFNLRVVEMGAKRGWIPVFGQRIPVKLGKGGVAKGEPTVALGGVSSAGSRAQGQEVFFSNRKYFYLDAK